MSTGTRMHRHAHTAIVRTLPLLTLLLVSVLAQAMEAPRKSPADDNDYRFIELDNGLRAILVSDRQADKAAASLNVAVGSGDDPAGREGMAHFLEHMLFLGTEKYPEPGEYQQFIKSHGGSHNAFTAFQDTNYFFDVEARFLEPALDRFAEQFAAPLFTPELVDRERNAVHSEFSSKQKEDGRRFYSVKKAASNPDHAFSQFAVGNLSTLANTEEQPLRPDLIEFWKSHYSANLMTLAVYGPQSLDDLEQMVRSRFSAIENRNLTAKTFPQPLYQPEQLPAKVTADAIKDVRSLSLSFPIPSQDDKYRTKPASYVANLLGHEGPGSLFDVLKRAGLVESLSAGLGMDTGDNATLEVSMTLTPAGLAQQDDILPLVFDYIDRIREEGISEERFREMQQLAQIDFRFREQGEPVHEATSLSRQLRYYPAEDVLSAPWLLERYAPEQYRAILERLTPDNVMVFVLAPDPALDQPAQTPWYEAEWQRQPLNPTALTEQRLPELAAQLSLPYANPFIPEDLDMVAGATMEQPALLASPGGLDLWFARDTRFDTPKANVFISLRTPAARVSARSSVLTQLLVDAVNTNLNAWAYSARLAGLDYSVYPHLRGITVRVGGYNDKLHTLINRILMQLANPTLTQQRFDIARQNLVDSLQNKAKDRPVEQTSEFVQTALIEGAWPTEDKLEAARQVSLDELKSFSEALLSEVDPVVLAHGNLSRAYTLNLAQQIRAIVLKNSTMAEVERSRVRQLPAEETQVTLDVRHPDTGYTLYMQGENTGFAERARFRLLAQIISSPFYEDIRTTRQLGYIVYATPFEILETPALGFVVQSPKATQAQIDQAVREFSAQFEARLASMDQASLNREKQAVISKLLERDRQLGDISGRYWREIDRAATDFDSRERLAEAVQAVKKDALLETFREAVLNRERTLRVVTGQSDQNADSALSLLLAQPPVPAS
ncbi:insulinase family protein [Marinobacter qingdaonensis]|uniref:Protease 3 n=1 Tax=Marinobacter qingdaonensis TaxID=3108486 RepID=A0ABU5NTD9_9GAMM|nr:insulinase family protein [Marinobacter sp. ASW11-75]MEA1079061.1 insulinase family protein [Marinobacter sp. ASW11-75]